jgi:hypothetical protein
MQNKASSFLPRIQPGVEEPWVDNRVPGAVGAITDWINAQSLRPFPIFALGAAIVVVGTIIGRKVRGPQGGPTHLYMIGLLPTGWGKDGPLGGALRLLTAFDESLIGPDQFVSSQGVYRQLIAQPLCCCIVDELGEQIELLNDQSGNGFVTMVFSTLKIAYNGWKDVRTAATAHSDSKIIRCPAPSILGAGTPEEFFRALKAKDLKGGFVNRLLVLPFEGHRKPPEKIRTATVEPPQALLDRLRALPRLGVLESSLDKKLPAPMDIPWADDGAARCIFCV